MEFTVSDFNKMAQPGKHAHLVGIGGVSMSPLAEVLHGMGLIVSGSDINDSDTVRHLRETGITVFIGHDPSNINGADLLIRTAAAHDDNIEVSSAREAGIPVFERAQAWGSIMKSYKNAVCISGTHGKTTTTSMMTHILMEARKDPTVMIGGTLPLLGSGYRVGEGDTIVLESCEYYNSFHSFSPTVAVVLNIDNDHLDFFKNLDNIKASFRTFASLVPQEGTIVASYDDENTMDALKPLGRELLTFGLSDKARVHAENLKTDKAETQFDVYADGRFYASIHLNVPGLHNVRNALAASAAAWTLHIPADAVSRGLSSFHGTHRRFEYKGTVNGAKVYDDYAHHPGELRALMDMVLTLGYKRVIAAFQPHTYSRTKALLNDFAEQLSRADVAYLADIYAARETNTFGISSADLSALIPNSKYVASLSELTSVLKQEAREGDIIITIGAGNIYTVGESLIKSK